MIAVNTNKCLQAHYSQERDGITDAQRRQRIAESQTRSWIIL